MAEISFSNAFYFPIIQATTLVCGTLLCFIVAYSRGDVSLYLPFISETGAYSPEKCIFSLTLIIGSFLGIIFMFYQHIITKNFIDGRIFSVLNKAAVFFGIFSMLGLAGVAAFPMTTVFWAHLMFASFYFVGSAIYFILVTVITYKVQGFSKLFKLRITLSVFILIFLILITILFPLSLVKWRQENDFIPALKTPEFKGFTLLLLSAILEWSIVIVILLFHISIIMDLKSYSFTITASQQPSKIAPVIDGSTPVEDVM